MNSTKERPVLLRTISTRVIVGFFLAVVLGSLIISVVPSTNAATISITEEEKGELPPIETSPLSLNPRNEVIFLDEVPHPESDSWNVGSWDYSQGIDSALRVELTNSGMELEMGESGYDASHSFILAFADYEEVTLNISFEVLTGSVRVYTRLFLSEPYNFDSIYHKDREEIINAGNGTYVQYLWDVPVSFLKNRHSSSWAMQASVGISFHSFYQAKILFHEASLVGISNYTLHPLVLDFQSMDGTNLFSGMMTSEYYADYYSLNLTRDFAPSQFAILVPNTTNQTVYVRSGSYRGNAGIGDYFVRNTTHDIEFQVNELDGTLLTVRFNVIMMQFDFNLHLPQMSLSVVLEEEQEHFFQETYYYSSLDYPYYMFIPVYNGTIHIQISHHARLENRFVSYHTEIECDGDHNLKVDIDLPFFPLFGVALTTGELIVIVVGLALIFASVLNLYRPVNGWDIRQIVTNPRFPPVMLLTLGVIFPWFTTITTEYGLSEGNLVLKHSYVPFSLVMEQVSGSLLWPLLSNWIWVVLPTVIIGFWIPYRYSMSGLLSEHKWEFDAGYFSYLFFPALLAVVFYVFQVVPLLIAPGFVFVVSAPLVWLIEVFIYRRWKQK